MALDQERASLEFSPSNITSLLYGNFTSKLLTLWQALADDPDTQNSPDIYAATRPQALERTYKVVATLLSKYQLYQLDDLLVWDVMKHVGPTPIDTHLAMFRLGIKTLGSSKQRSKWLSLIHQHKVFGCYAQTELGHGSDVKNLETTAIYDKATQEFVINTPTLSATKFWVGGLGLTATHCLLFAKLISDGSMYGIHPFIVPIRSFDSHLPLKGVTVGDVGPKMGCNTVDNGFLQLHNVRVPLENLLSKYGKLRKDGSYFAPPYGRLRYFVMLQVRVGLIRDCSRYLAKALTIAVRYGIVRTQFKTEADTERKLLDYQMHQMKLFVPLANCYAMYLASHKVLDMNQALRNQLKAGDLSAIKETHSIAAGLKALFSDLALEGIELCRESCGGHGYSLLSGLPSLYTNFAPTVTYEGDNSILYLQCARYLVKSMESQFKKVVLKGHMEYLNYISDYMRHKSFVKVLSDFSNVFVFEEMVRVRAAFLAKRTMEQIAAERSEGYGEIHIFHDRLQPELIQFAKAHLYLFVFLQMKDIAIAQRGKVKKYLLLLTKLFAGIYLLDGLAELYECGFLQDGLTEGLLRQSVEDLLTSIRPSAIGLVDAFGFTDNALNSALGCYDGKVYERLVEWTQNSRLDVTEAMQSYYELVKPNLNPRL